MGRIIHVSKENNRTDFHSLREALEEIPKDNEEQVTIYLHEGSCREKLTIDKPYITLVGDSPDNLIYRTVAACLPFTGRF